MAYKVLIIGCGAIAGGYDAQRSPDDWPLSHAGAIARDERFKLVACVDPDDAAREAFAERWDVPVAVSDLDSLKAKEGHYDLIVIASPTQYHAEHLKWAHRVWPKAVFCEKPVSLDSFEAFRLHYGFSQNKLPLVVNYTRRWQPTLEPLIDDIRNDEWGDLISATGIYAKGIMHNGSHLLDLLDMFVGPMTLQAVGPHWFDHWDDDPSVSAILTANDMEQPIHLVPGVSHAFTQFEIVLTYQFGEIAIRDGGFRIETRRVEESDIFPGYRTLGPVSQQAGRYEEAMTLAYDNLAEVLAGKGDPKFDHGNAALALCERIRKLALETPMKDPE